MMIAPPFGVISQLPSEYLPRIQAMAVPLIGGGVYILSCGDKVMYVGQSTNPRSRIAQHLGRGLASSFKNQEMFTHATIVWCPGGVDEMNDVESRLCYLLRPPLNGIRPYNGEFFMPLSASEVFTRYPELQRTAA